MQSTSFDAVVISSQVSINPPRPSTLSYLKHCNIPVVVIWDAPYSEPACSYCKNSTHNVVFAEINEATVTQQIKLWPPIDSQTFHDTGSARTLELFCIGDVLDDPISLHKVQSLLEAGITPSGIRDWRYEYFTKNGRSLNDAKAFKSTLFDPGFYMSTYTIELPQETDPLTHYMQIGWKQNYNPNPLFDTAYYRSRYPDCEAEDTNPLLHFANSPAHFGRNPHPLFDPLYYLAKYPEVIATGLNPLEHYLQYGVSEGKMAVAPLIKHEYAVQLKQSRIALNLRSYKHDGHAALRKAFEAISCGTLLLEPEMSPLAEWFTPMVDYVPFTNEVDLVAKVRHYLANEGERAGIAGNGCQKAASTYTGHMFWRALCATILPENRQMEINHAEK
jgi:hypothetical protein